MAEWIELHKEFLSAAWYGFMAGLIMGMLLAYNHAASLIKKRMRKP